MHATEHTLLRMFLRLRSHDAVMIWKRNKIITERSPVHTMPVWNHLKTVRNENGTLIGVKWKRNSYWCEMKTELYPASCEHLSIRNGIMTVPGQWCRFQVIPASCERGLNIWRQILFSGDLHDDAFQNFCMIECGTFNCPPGLQLPARFSNYQSTFT